MKRRKKLLTKSLWRRKKNLTSVVKVAGKKSKKPKKKTRKPSVVKRELDKVFSIYIRQSAADPQGYASCVTCGKSLPWQQQQSGHFVPRSHLSTRWDPRNVHVQCVGCNIFGGGRYPEYALFLTRKYGPEILEELTKAKHTVTKISVQEMEQSILFYKALTGEL